MSKKYFLFFGIILAVSLISLVIVSAASSYSGSLTVSSGGGRIIISGPGQTPQHYCGNGVYEPYIYEQCDGNDLGGASCASLGYDFGSLSCKANCVYDTSACGNNPSTPTQPGGGSGGGGGGSGSSSSSSSGSKSCVENWQCTNWSECKNGKQTRSCTDSNNCGTVSLKPAESGDCTSGNLKEGNEAQETGSGILGAVIGGGAGSIILAIIFIVIVIVSSTIIVKLRKK